MRVLLFSNDLMPFGGLPTSGGGLRCWQLMKGLECHGIEVLASMPSFTYLAEKNFKQIPQAQRDLLWQWDKQDEILARVKPDAVLFASNWDHFALKRPLDIPLIIDLHGSRLIETTMWNNPVSTDRKVDILGRADCLLAAGERQRLYFYGWLLQGGRVPEDEHFIRYIPVSQSPESPDHIYPAANDLAFPQFVSGGGWFPWQNQAKAIFEVCTAVERHARGAIEIYGTPHETQTVSGEEQYIRDVYRRVKDLSERCPRIRVHGYVGREELIEVYRRASIAVEVMRYNLERELAFTTRTVEYLWCGLPVMYNDFGELSEHISQYDAGWAIPADNEQAIASVVEEIFANPKRVEEKSRNAKRLVADRFSWDKTIEPLVGFLRNPKKAGPARPIVGVVCARSSFLSPRGLTADVPLYADKSWLSQQFMVPAENIGTVGITLRRGEHLHNSRRPMLDIRIKRPRGKVISQRTIPVSKLATEGQVNLALPLIFRPAGGEALCFELRLREKRSCACSCGKGQGSNAKPASVYARALVQASFPFIKAGMEEVKGETPLGEVVNVEALALSFEVGGARLYRVKSLLSRGFVMIKDGEWGRLSRAVFRRFPGLMGKVREHLFAR